MVSHLAIVGSPYVGNGISSELITWHQWIWTNSIVHIIVLTSWIAMAQIIICDLGWLISPFRSTSGHCPNLIATGLRRMRDRLTTNAPFRYTAVVPRLWAESEFRPRKKPSKTIKNLWFIMVYRGLPWFIMVHHDSSWFIACFPLPIQSLWAFLHHNVPQNHE